MDDGSRKGQQSQSFQGGYQHHAASTVGSTYQSGYSARGGNVRLPKLKEATLHDPLSGKVTPLSGSDGLEVPVKSSLQMLVWE